MHTAMQPSATDNQLLFLPGIFNETLSLLFDAHQYFETRGPEEQSTIDPEIQIAYANEMSRVTLRLTSVMAWLMVRRAVYAGRIEEEKASDDYRLEGQEVCEASEAPELLGELPDYLLYLSDRSTSLYARIQRLDAEAYGTRH